MSAFSMLLTLAGAGLEQGRTGSPHHPQDDHCLPRNTLKGAGEAGRRLSARLHGTVFSIGNIIKILRAGIATSLTSVSLTQLPHQFRENIPCLSLIFIYSPAL